MRKGSGLPPSDSEPSVDSWDINTHRQNTHWDPGAFPWARLIARLEENDLFSRTLDPETWGVLFDRGIVEEGTATTTRQELIDFWTSPDRNREEHHHATNVIIRQLALADGLPLGPET